MKWTDILKKQGKEGNEYSNEHNQNKENKEEETGKKKKNILFIIIVVLIVVILLFFLFGLRFLMNINKKECLKSPVIRMEAYCNKNYPVNEDLQKKDFQVYLIHEKKEYKERVDAKNYTFSQKRIEKVGEETTIKITANIDTEEYECNVTVKAEREEIERYECGYPNLSDVNAVVYSNGELCFEGKGDVAAFSYNNYPWKAFDSAHAKDETPITIKSITFRQNVIPVSMNYWFNDMTNIEFVDRIPKSVESMNGTFSGCVRLEEGANWTQCSNLTSIKQCYSGCTSLTYAPAIPQYVREASGAFAGCVKLENTPESKYAVSLVQADNMYNGCLELKTASLPPYVENIDYCFSECINLREMPEIPETVNTMNSSFMSCRNIETITNIPEDVTNMSACFKNCERIQGDLIIDAEPEDYKECFTGAATYYDVNLTGPSRMLDCIALTGGKYMKVHGNEVDSEPVIRSKKDLTALEQLSYE